MEFGSGWVEPGPVWRDMEKDKPPDPSGKYGDDPDREVMVMGRPMRVGAGYEVMTVWVPAGWEVVMRRRGT